MRTLIEALAHRVLLADGSTTRLLRARAIDPKRDLWCHEDFPEFLNLTRAPLVRGVHIAYLRAGADIVRTNTLAASPLSLAPLGLADHAFYLNFAAAQLAAEAIDSVPGRGRRRFALGVVRDQGWEAPPLEIERAVAVQVEGLIAGGVDGIALDLTPGTGRAPIFLKGARKGRQKLKASAPLFLLRGTGLEFSAHALAQADGVIRHRSGLSERGQWLSQAIEEEGINLLGGGSSPQETRRIDNLLRLEAEDGLRPYRPSARPPVLDEVTPPSSLLHYEPALAEPLS